MEALDINAAVRGIADMLQRVLGEDIELSVRWMMLCFR